MKLLFIPRVDETEEMLGPFNGSNGTGWLFIPDNHADFKTLEEFSARFLPTIQACDRCGAYDVDDSHWPCTLPRVGGEQPVRASSDESQQPRDDPARPE